MTEKVIRRGKSLKCSLSPPKKPVYQNYLNIYFCINKTFKLSLISRHRTFRTAQNSRFHLLTLKAAGVTGRCSSLGKNARLP